MRKLILFLLFSTFLGCGASDIIVTPLVNGVIMWKEGEAQKYYAFPSKHVYLSMKHVLDNNNLKITQDIIEKNNTFKVSAGKENKFYIKIVPAEPNICRVDIRVDFLGNKPYAELLYKELDSAVNTIEFDSTGRVKVFSRTKAATNRSSD